MGRKDGVGVREFQFNMVGATKEVLAAKVTSEQSPAGRMSPCVPHHCIPKKKKEKKRKQVEEVRKVKESLHPPQLVFTKT